MGVTFSCGLDFFEGIEGGIEGGRGGGEEELLATIRSVTGVKMKSLSKRDKSKEGLSFSFSTSTLNSCVVVGAQTSSSIMAESAVRASILPLADREAVDEGFRPSELRLLVEEVASSSSPKSSPNARTGSKTLPLVQPPTPLLLPLLESSCASTLLPSRLRDLLPTASSSLNSGLEWSDLSSTFVGEGVEKS